LGIAGSQLLELLLDGVHFFRNVGIVRTVLRELASQTRKSRGNRVKALTIVNYNRFMIGNQVIGLGVRRFLKHLVNRVLLGKRFKLSPRHCRNRNAEGFPVYSYRYRRDVGVRHLYFLYLSANAPGKS
jgi:hypothetical protein